MTTTEVATAEGNVRTMLNVDLRRDKMWASVYSTDLVTVLGELDRLKAMEDRLKHEASMNRQWAQGKREDSAALLWAGRRAWSDLRLRESKAYDAEADKLEKLLGTVVR